MDVGLFPTRPGLSVWSASVSQGFIKALLSICSNTIHYVCVGGPPERSCGI